MRILILNWRDIKHPLAGGAEISTHEHAKRWAREGHKIIQFSSAISGEKAEENIDGVKILRRGSHYTVHIHAMFYFLKHFRYKIDLVIDQFHFIPFFTPLYVKTKIIAFIHEIAGETWFKNASFPINFIGYFFEPLFFIFYKNVPFVTVSESTKNDLNRLGIKNENINLIHNGVNLVSSVSKKEIDPTLIYLGRLAKDKGVEDAIYAFYKMQRLFNNITLWIVGKEEKKGYKNYLENILKKLNIDQKVKFWGHVSDKKKFDLLKKAWVLIHPSIKEGWGLTVIEAASCGTPTVAYNVSGLRDSIVNGKTGILVENKTPKELADQTISLLNNLNQYNILSKQAVEWGKKFSWLKSTNQSLELIEKIV